jgi:toluene monooxygenase system protein E
VAVNTDGLKTWSAFLRNRKRPSEYEVVTTNLQSRMRHPNQAYELSPAPLLPMNTWYQKNVSQSPLQHPDWEQFRDPDEVVYRTYTRIQDGQEEYVDGLLDEYDQLGHDASLSTEWLTALERLYTPVRYLMSGLQMGSAYLVQIVPASTLTACAGFQEADDFRWLSRVAYRARALQMAHPLRSFVKSERHSWEQDPAWQGLRELVERTLIAYDWGESFVALNLVVRPTVDEALRQLGRAARKNGDTLLGLLIDNQLRDGERSRRWSAAVVRFALEQASNGAVIAGWIAKWMPVANNALAAYCEALPDIEGASAQAKENITAFHRSLSVLPSS